MAAADVLTKLPGNFFELLRSSKWNDRRNALQNLLDELDAINPGVYLDPNANYGELMDELKKIIWKDSNVIVVALGAQALSGIAKGLSAKFSKYVPMFMSILFEKFKDKKASVRMAITECVDVIASTSHADSFIGSVVEVLEKKGVNPDVKANIDRWIYRTLLRYAPTDVPNGFIAKIAPFVAQHLSDGDPEVRNAGCMACGGVMRLLGEEAAPVLIRGCAEDKAKQKKISEFCEKAVSEAAVILKSMQTEGTKDGGDMEQAGDDKENEGGMVGGPALAVDPWELMEEVEILSKLPKDFLTMVDSKQWNDRLNALKDLNTILEKNERLSSKEDYRELMSVLAKLLGKDVNVNVAAAAAKCIKGLVQGIRFNFAPYSAMVLSNAFQKFKEKRAVLRESLIELVDNIAIVTPLSLYVDLVGLAMQQPNPQVKAQTALFIARLLKQHSAETLPDDFKSLVPYIIKLSSDSDTEVREASYAVVGAAMKSLSEKQLNVLFANIVNDNIKMSKAKEQFEKTVEESGKGPSVAILKMRQFAEVNSTISTEGDKKKPKHEDAPDSMKAAIISKRAPLQQAKQHTRMISGRATPKAVIPSSASTPYLPAASHVRPIVRSVSPHPNTQALKSLQNPVASMPKKVPSATKARCGVTVLSTGRSVAVPRGVAEHLARMARRHADHPNMQHDVNPRIRNTSTDRATTRTTTSAGGITKGARPGNNMPPLTSHPKPGPIHIVAGRVRSSTMIRAGVDRPATAPENTRNPSTSGQSDQNANVVLHANAVRLHPLVSHRGSRLPLPSSARR